MDDIEGCDIEYNSHLVDLPVIILDIIIYFYYNCLFLICFQSEVILLNICKFNFLHKTSLIVYHHSPP